MTINELSKITDTPISTIRFYEKKNVLAAPNRLSNNYRDYDEFHCKNLIAVKELISLGFSLEEIKTVFISNGKNRKSTNELKEILVKQGKLIQNKIERLISLRSNIAFIENHFEMFDSKLNNYITLLGELYEKNN